MKRCASFLLQTLFCVAALLTAQTAPEVEITAEPHHHFAFANDQVRVFNVEVAPHTDTLMHRHGHDYIYVQLGNAEVVNAVKDKPAVTVKLADGQAGFVAGGFAHIARNQTDQPFRNVTIEILQDDKLRAARSSWEEDRGLDVLHGGTRQILFVQDAIRVSEYELQPAGMVPEHHHKGPHLVVALTDYELRSDQTGKPPSTITMKRGEAHWVPGGFTHTLTNTGHTAAKFVTLEFP